MYKLYGIPNCDTVKKARAHLAKSKVEYDFVDFKKKPPTKTDISRWKKDLGDWPVNRKGRTFKALQTEFDAASATEKSTLLIENTSAIKRPILEKSGKIVGIGYDKDVYGAL